jgi:hypothetical protein
MSRGWRKPTLALMHQQREIYVLRTSLVRGSPKVAKWGAED